MAFAIAAPASGTGKTTVTLALLAALRRRGIAVQSFKVGPDYIDPMFHRAATGRPCYTLDPFLTSEDYVRRCFAVRCRDRQAALVEGVMGLFDGKVPEKIGASHQLSDLHENDCDRDFASTAHVARLLDIPVVLAIDAEKVGRTVAAIAYGLMQFDPRLRFAGVIFNRVGSDRHAELLRLAMEPLGLPVLGIVRTTPDIRMPSRHLGLVPVEEQQQFERLLDRLAHLAERSFDWERLLPLLSVSQGNAPAALWPALEPLQGKAPRIAIARDPAFNFYYADNIDLLKHLGAEVMAFSPLRSGFEVLTECDGLYLGGGFPEMFAPQLSERLRHNWPAPALHRGGLPVIYAECGGLMVLGQTLRDREGYDFAMAGLLPYTTTMTKKLTLGYRVATAIGRSPLWSTEVQSGLGLSSRASVTVRGHEFHHSICQMAERCSPEGSMSNAIYGWGNRHEGWGSDRVHASYLHLHWGEQLGLVRHWLQACLRQQQSVKSV